MTMTCSTMVAVFATFIFTFDLVICLQTTMAFRDPSGYDLQELVVDERSGDVLVGGTNRLHKLTTGLRLVQSSKTGPALDNADCPPPPRPCLAERKMYDAVTKGK